MPDHAPPPGRPTRTWRKITLALALLGVGNVVAWLWAIYELRPYPLLLGTALLAYSLGLRHAVDADHIAAIDNVTRRLMQDGQRPVCVGLFFSLVLLSRPSNDRDPRLHRGCDSGRDLQRAIGGAADSGWCRGHAAFRVISGRRRARQLGGFT